MKLFKARGAADSGINVVLVVAPAIAHFAGSGIFLCVERSWGFAALHPRLYAVARYRGLGAFLS